MHHLNLSSQTQKVELYLLQVLMGKRHGFPSNLMRLWLKVCLQIFHQIGIKVRRAFR